MYGIKPLKVLLGMSSNAIDSTAIHILNTSLIPRFLSAQKGVQCVLLTHQGIKYVSLMEVDGDECFKLGPLDLG